MNASAGEGAYERADESGGSVQTIARDAGPGLY